MGDNHDNESERDLAPVQASNTEELYEEQEEEKAEIMEYVPKLSTKAQRVFQILLGWLFGFLIWFCMALGLYFPDNLLISWSFLIVFAVAMYGRNAIERRTGIALKLYMRHFLISLIVFLAVFVILGPVTHVLDPGV